MFHESFRMRGIRRRQNLLSLLQNRFRLSVMHDGRGQQTQPSVMMRLIVPGEERLRPRTRIN